ncbi:MAG: efflux RND transporter periplasmic adaptor subunit [Planctomycetota bacterium]|nr:efflux RND transporter periplasmic adaptor subunit [Planctomycetota bacterium]
MKRFLVISTLICLAAIAGWFAHGVWSKQRGTNGSQPEAATVRVRSGRIEQAIKARGIVKPAPNALVRVGFPMPKDVSRRIIELPWVEGDAVKAGETLAQLDVSDLQATLAQLTTESKVFEQKLVAAKAIEPVEIKAAEARLAAAEAHQSHTKRVHERLAKLVGTTSAASTLETETALNDYDVAQAQLAESKAALQQVKEKFRTDILVLESQLANSQAVIRNSEVQIRWSTLIAPIDGQILMVNQHQGELTSNNPANPVLTMLDLAQLQLHLYVDESDFGRVQVAQRVTFRVDSYPGEIIAGNIVRLLPQPILQENVVYYLAVVEIDAAQRSLLRPEMTALAYVQTAARENALTLPLTAVKSRSDGWFVMVPAEGGPVEKSVKIGPKSEGRAEIVDGLKAGDEVLEEP